MTRAFKITNPIIKRERAEHKRDLRAPQILERDQAQRYAAFLLGRDGIDAKPEAIDVKFEFVRIASGRNVKRAWQYRYNGKIHDFPHREFIAREPVYELAD
jgi:hypothetical protein